MSPDTKKFSLTTPLYYVNDVPHIGSAYTTIACDVINRFYKLRGYDTYFVTGTDEHGRKIQKSAEAKGKSPQEHCDEIANEFIRLWKVLNIDYDSFSRTTSTNHEAIVKEFFNRVHANGDIYEDSYEGLYCDACEDFWIENDLLDDNLCPIHKTKVQEYREKNYFFALSKYEDKLNQYIEENPDFIQPEFRKNEVLGWIKQGLKDFPISRQSVKWGFPVPIDEKQTIYVWFDALLGYITGLLEDGDEPTLANATKKHYPFSVHIIGKDILRFHAVYWPCMLMSAGIPLPGKVFGHGFLTKDGEKMGKTTGNVIDPYEFAENYGVDAVRYFFMREVTFGKDGDFTYDNFISRINSDLANNLGNLLNRTLTLVNKNFNGEIYDEHCSDTSALALETKKALEIYEKHIKDFQIKEALEAIWKLVDFTNKNFNDVAPWKLIKENRLDEAKVCLYATLEVLRNTCIAIYPIIPETSSKMYSQIGYDKLNEDSEWTLASWNIHNSIFKVCPGEPVFPRIEYKNNSN